MEAQIVIKIKIFSKDVNYIVKTSQNSPIFFVSFAGFVPPCTLKVWYLNFHLPCRTYFLQFWLWFYNESIKNRGNLDLSWLETFGDFSEYRSKHHKPKWKPVQHHVRTLPGLKSIWFLISEKFLKFDEKNLSSQPKTCSLSLE